MARVANTAIDVVVAQQLLAAMAAANRLARGRVRVRRARARGLLRSSAITLTDRLDMLVDNACAVLCVHVDDVAPPEPSTKKVVLPAKTLTELKFESSALEDGLLLRHPEKIQKLRETMSFTRFLWAVSAAPRPRPTVFLFRPSVVPSVLPAFT